MTKSVAPELREYLRTKFANPFLRTAPQAEPSLTDSFSSAPHSAPPSHPAAEDIYNRYAPEQVAPLTSQELANAGTGAEVSYNPFTPQGRDRLLDRFYNTPAVENLSNAYASASKSVKDNARVFKHFADRNPLYNINASAPGRALVRGADALTDPKNGNNAVSASINAAVNGGDAPAASAAPAAAAAASKPANGAMFPMDPNLAYGLGGAGAGALLAATMSPRGKRGRNALLGAGLGGGAGLLANYLMNQNQKTAANMLHDALGTGAGGAVIGGLYGALTAGKKKLLRSALRGALIGGGTGTALGAGAAAFGEPVGPTSDNPSAAEHSGFNRGFGSATAGALGAALSQRLADEYLPLENEEEKIALDVVSPLKNIGEGAWNATKNMYGKVHNMIPVTALEGAGLGGVGAATVGGTIGLLHPGEYNEYDEDGNFIGKKRRSRFMGSMYGSTIGKILGTVGGGVAGHMYPEKMHELNQQIMNYGSGAYKALMGGGGQQPKPPAYQPVTPYLPNTKFDTKTRQPISQPSFEYPFPAMQ